MCHNLEHSNRVLHKEEAEALTVVPYLFNSNTKSSSIAQVSYLTASERSLASGDLSQTIHLAGVRGSPPACSMSLGSTHSTAVKGRSSTLTRTGLLLPPTCMLIWCLTMHPVAILGGDMPHGSVSIVSVLGRSAYFVSHSGNQPIGLLLPPVCMVVWLCARS